MTEEDRLLLNELKTNVQQLFQEYEQVESEKKLLKEQITELKETISRLQADKHNLDRQNKNILLANHILSGKDSNGEARREINKLVREIDKCIALLNK